MKSVGLNQPVKSLQRKIWSPLRKKVFSLQIVFRFKLWHQLFPESVACWFVMQILDLPAPLNHMIRFLKTNSFPLSLLLPQRTLLNACVFHSSSFLDHDTIFKGLQNVIQKDGFWLFSRCGCMQHFQFSWGCSLGVTVLGLCSSCCLVSYSRLGKY